MKLLPVLIFLFLNQNLLWAKQIHKRHNYKYPSPPDQIELNGYLNWSNDSFNAQSRLKEIKFLLVNGNLDKAKILLNQSALSIEFTKTIQYRYLAMIYFIEGNYEEALKILDKQELNDLSVLPKVCFIKVLSEIILEKTQLAIKDWEVCKQSTISYSNTNLTWMQTIVDLKTTSDKSYIKNYFNKLEIDKYGHDFFRIYLKLALYLNQQDKIIPQFRFFSKDVLEDEVERELIGLNYYRNGEIIKAHELLKDLNTANAEVFKGNLYLHQKKYEPAFAQFKLALQRKSNSQNALERLLPISWKLSQWEDGLNYLHKLKINSEDSIENNTLMGVFSAMANKHDETYYYLRRIDNKTNLSEPIEVSQLKVLNSLKRKNYDEVIDPAIKSCTGNDGINCWFIMALYSWESLIDYLGKTDQIHKGLKSIADEYRSSEVINPINENKLLEQKSIEEMDNNLIIL